MIQYKCKCNKETYHIRFEADFGADPVWCYKCGCNLDLGSFELSEKFMEEISQWIPEYGEWLNLDTDSLVEGADEMQSNFNKQGLILYEKIKKELSEKYTVEFKPADSVRGYENV